MLGDKFLCGLGLALELLDPVDDDCLVDPAGALGGHVISEFLAPVDGNIRKCFCSICNFVPLVVCNCIMFHVLAKCGVFCMATLRLSKDAKCIIRTHYTLSYPSRSEMLQAFSMAMSHSLRTLYDSTASFFSYSYRELNI